MSDKDKKQLEFEIRHIFESGENELRIYDMVVNFIEKRYENPLDKSIEQRAEEMADERYVLHVFKDRHVINRERAAFIEGYKACQQNLEVSERLYTKEEMMSFAIFTHSFAEVNLEGVFEIFESLPKANS